ncbi:ABC transporter permease subunit [Orbaceae bacterium ESL0727]|nr:ABC transporter permease subunit [Orbaceae bacterium ESL0727]
MVIYILRKIFTFLFILFLLAQISFCLAYFAPDSLLNPLNLLDAYQSFFTQLLSGEFTLDSGETVPVLRMLSATFELCLLALFVSILIGIPIGIFLGLSHLNWLNNIIKITCLVIYACPLIWLVILIMYLLSPNWSLFINLDTQPAITGLSLLDILITPGIDKSTAFIEQIQYLLLPTIILAIQPCIITIQLVSQNVKNTTHQNYIKMAIIREASPLKVLMRHLLPNSIPAIIPQLSYNTSTLLFSTMVIEILFNRIGLGQWVIMAYHQFNYNIIAIAILACGTVTSLLTLLSEISVLIIYPMRHKENYV